MAKKSLKEQYLLFILRLGGGMRHSDDLAD